VRPPLAALGLGATAAAVGGGLALVHQPRGVVLGLVAVAVLAAMALRVEWALLAYVAAEPFGDYLGTLSPVSIKAVGGLLFLAWLLRLVTRVRPVAVRHGATYAAGVLAIVLCGATVFHANGSAGLVVAGRFVSYLAVLVVIVDTVRTGLPARRLVAVFVWSCTVAATVGLIGYLDDPYGRAGGPIADPNDFAFFLVCALPLALALWRTGTRARHLYLPAVALLLLGTLATYSRGAVVGLLAALGYAVLTRQVRPRVLVAGGTAVAGLLAAVLLAAPTLIQSSLEAKQNVGQQNVDDRLTAWSMATEMIAGHPVLGLGPAGFRTNYDSYLHARQTDPAHLDVAHETYLEVGSELGLVGLAAFGWLLAAGIAGARRATGLRSAGGVLADGVGTAFASTLVAAAFLSEQFFLPLWLLVGLGAALDPRARSLEVRPARSSVGAGA
jgi:O-antigen ligase